MADENCHKTVGDYTLKKLIGRGSFAAVYLARRGGDGRAYALKVLPKDGGAAVVDSTEAKIMAAIRHPNVLRLHEIVESARNVYLVTDYCSQGDVLAYLQTRRVRRLEEGEALRVFAQIREGFRALRRHKVFHRDFKPSNLLVDGDSVRIADFGLAKRGDDIAQTVVGSYLTMAPELLRSLGAEPYTSKADLWSIGCVFYQLLVGHAPFLGMCPGEILADIRAQGGRPALPVALAPPTADLLRRLLQVDPDRRIDWPAFFAHSALAGESPAAFVARTSLKGYARRAALEMRAAPSEATRRRLHESAKTLFLLFTARKLRKGLKNRVWRARESVWQFTLSLIAEARRRSFESGDSHSALCEERVEIAEYENYLINEFEREFSANEIVRTKVSANEFAEIIRTENFGEISFVVLRALVFVENLDESFPFKIGERDFDWENFYENLEKF